MAKLRGAKAGDAGKPAWSVILYPHLAEKSMGMVESQNRLVFMVRRKATRAEIREDVERSFGVKVKSVNVEITPDGKKAYVRLSPESSASDVASRLGVI
jgi:large subunit ribosomal protein L23